MSINRMLVAVTVLAMALTGAALAQRAGGEGERNDRDDVVTLDGAITEVALPFATLKAGGTDYTLHLGPRWFWVRNGYDLAAGDKVTVVGQVDREGDRAHVYLHAITRDGTTWRFAGDDGVPLWAGGPGHHHGRGYGHGHGYGYGPGHCQGAAASEACAACPRCADCPHAANCPRCPQGQAN